MNKNIAVASTFIWIGFVAAISFMEAWLKFRAPGVTLPIGLSIGRLVFAALNKVEWVLLVTIITSLLPFKHSIKISKIALAIAAVVLIVQTTWLLPALDARAALHIAGAHVLPSNAHFYFAIAECVKVIALVILGRSSLTASHSSTSQLTKYV